MIFYRRFGTTYLSHRQGSRDEPIRLFRNVNHYSLRNSRAEHISQLIRGGSLKSREENTFCACHPSVSCFCVSHNGEINNGNRILFGNFRESDVIREVEKKERVESQISKEKLREKKENRFCLVEMWGVCFFFKKEMPF